MSHQSTSNGGGPAITPTLSARTIYTDLRSRILRGTLDQGSSISQVQLSRQLGVSRTPLREALRMLQRDGLVESEPNRRVKVSRMSLGELEQLYATRVVLESLGIRFSARKLTAEDYREISRSLVELERLAEGHDFDAWEVADRSLHEHLHKYAGGRLNQLLRDLWDHTSRYRR